jgi:hypothetical protein
MTVEIRYTVLSPEAKGQKVSAGVFPQTLAGPAPAPGSPSMARRLDTLENKTVYLVDTGFGGSYKFMLQLQKWFNQHMPSVTTIRKRKTGGAFMDDTTDLWEEIRARGDAAVVGVGG